MAYNKNIWSTGDTITASLANNWETQYDEAISWAQSYGLGDRFYGDEKTDINVLDQTGFYRCSSTATGKPSDSAYGGYVIHFKLDSDSKKQVFFDHNSEKVWDRVRSNSATWTTWQRTDAQHAIDTMHSYGLGGSKILSTPDVNTLSDTGFFYIDGGTNIPSGLEGNGNGFLLVQSHETNDGYVSQIYIPYREGETFTRVKDNGTWTEWTQTATQDWVQSFGLGGKLTEHNKFYGDLNDLTNETQFVYCVSATNQPSSDNGYLINLVHSSSWVVQIFHANGDFYQNTYKREMANGTWNPWRKIAMDDEVVRVDGSNAMTGDLKTSKVKDATNQYEMIKKNSQDRVVVGDALTVTQFNSSASPYFYDGSTTRYMETTTGAQDKADTAESNAKSASVPRSEIRSNYDLNTMKSSGVYALGGTLTNGPPNGDGLYGTLTVTVSGDVVTQQVNSYKNNGKVYYRSGNGSTFSWSSWILVVDSLGFDGLKQFADDFKSVNGDPANAIIGKGGTLTDGDSDGYHTKNEMVDGINSINTGNKPWYSSGVGSVLDNETGNGIHQSYTADDGYLYKFNLNTNNDLRKYKYDKTGTIVSTTTIATATTTDGNVSQVFHDCVLIYDEANTDYLKYDWNGNLLDTFTTNAPNGAWDWGCNGNGISVTNYYNNTSCDVYDGVNSTILFEIPYDNPDDSYLSVHFFGHNIIMIHAPLEIFIVYNNNGAWSYESYYAAASTGRESAFNTGRNALALARSLSYNQNSYYNA